MKDGMWVSLKAKVVQLWENDNHHLANRPSATTPASSSSSAFTKSDLPLLKEGESYHLTSLVTDRGRAGSR